MDLGPGIFLVGFLAVTLALAFYLGRSPVSGRVVTMITQKRVRFQETMVPSGNAYVPIKSEVYTLNTEVAFDIFVSKSLWDKLEAGDRIEVEKHLDGTYTYHRKVVDQHQE